MKITQKLIILIIINAATLFIPHGLQMEICTVPGLTVRQTE